MNPNGLISGQAVPVVNVVTIDRARSVLRSLPRKFDLIALYRRVHWPIYADYVMEPERFAPESEKRSVRMLALSSDPEERARKMANIACAESPLLPGVRS